MLSPFALILSAAGPVLLRGGWRRAAWPIVAGWTCLTIAAVLLCLGSGFWGLSIGVTIACAMALILLGWEAGHAPSGSRSGGARRGNAVQSSGGWRFDPRAVDWSLGGRRIGTFLLAGPLALAAAFWLAWTGQRLVFAHGWTEADATMLALLVLPVAWIAIASWQMSMKAMRARALAPLPTILLGVLLWLMA